MTTPHHYGREKNRLAAIAATLNDVNAKVGYLIQMLREERDLAPPADAPRDGAEIEANGDDRT